MGDPLDFMANDIERELQINPILRFYRDRLGDVTVDQVYEGAQRRPDFKKMDAFVRGKGYGGDDLKLLTALLVIVQGSNRSLDGTEAVLQALITGSGMGPHVNIVARLKQFGNSKKKAIYEKGRRRGADEANRQQLAADARAEEKAEVEEAASILHGFGGSSSSDSSGRWSGGGGRRGGRGGSSNMDEDSFRCGWGDQAWF